MDDVNRENNNPDELCAQELGLAERLGAMIVRGLESLADTQLIRYGEQARSRAWRIVRLQEKNARFPYDPM